MGLSGLLKMVIIGRKQKEEPAAFSECKSGETSSTVKEQVTVLTAEEKAISGQQEIPLDVKRSMENIYDNSKVVELAEQCKMGDIVAMMDMAKFFRDRCTEPLVKLLDQYEAEPTRENETLIEKHLKVYYHEENTAKAYMMWLCRAALYGNDEAAQMMEHWPFYKKNAYLPYDMLAGKGNFSKKLWASNFLWKIGFIDMIRDHEDCGLDFHFSEKYFDFWYVDSYCPADDDGFGAEWDYASVFYDEFFCRIPTREWNKIPEELKKLERKREQYWNDPTHNASGRKYHRKS
ncbi:MAG: hypothetical protein Q4F83_14940 [Eubacteriales bacterium]|nr:hypothetical protein [Eubacteriales bacterium]